MFQLYKKRSFGDMISDTFTFLKLTGKHFFKNYFVVTGIFILLFMVLMYIVSKVYFDAIFSSIGTTYGTNPMESLFEENLGLIIITLILFILTGVLVSLVNYSFPVSYMNLFVKNKQTTNFTSTDIINQMKASIGKLLIYFLGLIFIFTPIIIVAYLILLLLSFIIIGLPLMLIVFPMLMSWTMLTLFYHLNTEDGFFTSMANAWRGIMQNFWSIVGSTLVIYLIVSAIVGIVYFLFYIVIFAVIFGVGTTTGLEDPDSFSFIGILTAVVMIVVMLVSFITNNLFMINQGMIYYSLVEQKENIAPQSEIDLIGTEE